MLFNKVMLDPLKIISQVAPISKRSIYNLIDLLIHNSSIRFSPVPQQCHSLPRCTLALSVTNSVRMLLPLSVTGILSDVR